jgi:rSAM/selenodomain-associated transferase 1
LRAATPARPEAILIVFARAPVPGRVKTRLAATIGSLAAAQLHAQLLERAVATAVAARAGVVELHCAPDARHPRFRSLAERYGIALRAQPRGDLGERMHRALARALRSAEAAVLIGSDCPALRAADLRRAVRLLREGSDAVFAPAADGGYVLVGLRRSAPRLFSGIAWGGARVMAATRDRLRRLGWSWRELRALWDVDRPADHARLRRSRLLARPVR